MKTLKLFFFVIFLLFYFQNSNGQVLENGYYIGKEKFNILQTFYYLITINDSTASFEFYMISKGQTSSIYFFNNKIKMPIAEQFKITSNECNCILKNNANKALIIRNNNEIILSGKDHVVKLIKVQEIPLEYYKMKNESLYTFAYFYPHLIMGYDIKYDNDNEIRIRSGLSNSNLLRSCGQLNYSEFEILLYNELEKVILNE